MAIDPTTIYGSADEPAGDDFLDQYKDVLTGLALSSVRRLTNIGGTANEITADAEEFSVPSTGYEPGMLAILQPDSDNTGAATLNIDGRGDADILNGNGSALQDGDLLSTTTYLLYCDGSDWIVIGAVGGATADAAGRTTYTSTAVFTNSYAANTLILVELWGAGGGGLSTHGGGGGGAYAVKMFTAGDLPSSVTITVPSGGAAGTVGGNCTFGSLLTAYGGGASTTSRGGGGAGTLSAGSGENGGDIGGGNGGNASDGSDATNIYSGGGGGTFTGGGVGGSAVFGGGGGGGGAAGGGSVYGGAGGNPTVAGSVPGGGGGRAAAGGRGEARVTVFGG